MAFWLIRAGLAAVTGGAAAWRFDLVGPDDHMRLLQIRAFLDGQAWHDLMQARLGADGLFYHWSRLADLPVAAIAFLLKPFLGLEPALSLAVIAAPLLLMLGLFAAVCSLAGRLAADGRAGWIAGALLLTAYYAIAQFLPGRIDHHGLQILFAAGSLLGVVLSIRRPAWALASAACAGLAIALGVEGVPYAVAAAAALALRALSGEARDGAALTYFGAGLSAALVVFYGRSGVWLTPYAQSCVAFSSVYLSAGTMLAAGCAACGLAFPRLSDVRLRLLAGAGVSAAAGAAFLWLYPTCPAIAWSPEGRGLAENGLDAELAALWLGWVRETLNAVELARADWRQFMPAYLFPAAALAACAWLWRSAPKRRDWLAACSVFLSVAFAVSLFQYRAAMFSQMLAVPPAAALIAILWRRAGERGASLVPAVLAAFILNGASYSAIAGLAPVTQSGRAIDAAARCESRESVQRLVDLPAGGVAAPINIGPLILAHTPHRVWAAPYSTNFDNTLAAYRAFAAPLGEAGAALAAMGADYVAICAGAMEERGIAQAYPNSLIAALLEGRPPAYLSVIHAPESGLRVYRVEGTPS